MKSRLRRPFGKNGRRQDAEVIADAEHPPRHQACRPPRERSSPASTRGTAMLTPRPHRRRNSPGREIVRRFEANGAANGRIRVCEVIIRSSLFVPGTAQLCTIQRGPSSVRRTGRPWPRRGSSRFRPGRRTAPEPLWRSIVNSPGQKFRAIGSSIQHQRRLQLRARPWNGRPSGEAPAESTGSCVVERGIALLAVHAVPVPLDRRGVLVRDTARWRCSR